MSRALSRRATLGLVACISVFAACQPVGLAPRPAAFPVPVESAELPPTGADAAREPLSAGDPHGMGEVEVASVDVILYSATSVDPLMREAADVWVTDWTTGRVETFQTYLARMDRYEGLVDEHIEARALPRSLRYLPLVESGYAAGAVSPAGATGLWQLMGPTARELGLTVNSIVDERRDPVASTSAALEYLERLHDEFDSWLLALAAYNSGPGRVRRALRRSGSSDVASGDHRFLEIRTDLPRETREFIPRFLAAAALAGDPAGFGFTPIDAEPLDFDEVVVPDATSLDVVARAADVSEEDIRRLNPHYVRGYTPHGELRMVRVPSGSARRFQANFAAIPPEDRLSFIEHLVQSGETFSHIAGQYGVPVQELVDTNRGLDPRRLQIGMTVVVPITGARQGSGLRARRVGG